MAFQFQEGEVLLFDKPLGWTSFDVVNFVRSFIRRMYDIKKLKVGHAGTLDPMATGLLILCTGKKTKAIDSYQGMDKVYVGEMQLGATTPSFDKETEIDKTFDISALNFDQLKETSTHFLGEIEQVPPLYSAIKIKGERAYNLVRKDQEVALKARKININAFNITTYESPFASFYVECSKGTYIRSLVRDFGENLSNGAYLTALKRTQIGDFKLSDAMTIDDFKQKVFLETGKEEASPEMK
ncbi:MAG: tRNA pseudouridine(55) synthase TruB [Bacteroidales bacterium]|nr:tRNA pseudouridine(55) synthase TruB [Bacteroidales bacterium]